MELLGSRLRNERKRLGLTQLAFAKIGGVEPNAQGHYENGHRSPKADYLQKLSDAGVDVAYLFSGTSSLADFVSERSMMDQPLPQRSGSFFGEAGPMTDNAASILKALHLSLSDTTDVIVGVAGCLSSPTTENREENFIAQVEAFREQSRHFINHALFRVKCPG